MFISPECFLSLLSAEIEPREYAGELCVKLGDDVSDELTEELDGSRRLQLGLVFSLQFLQRTWRSVPVRFGGGLETVTGTAGTSFYESDCKFVIVGISGSRTETNWPTDGASE